MLCGEEKCNGCGCCSAICPQQCITMTTGEFGGRLPKIDKEKCTGCGLCEKSCPVLNQKNESVYFPKVYSTYHKDCNIVKKSASGGAFSILSDYVFSRGGIVVGAVWRDDFSVTFATAKNAKEREAMFGSKYVQSNLGAEMYHKIKSYLESGIPVLFCGLPCQCAGVFSYLGKNYDNFICVDIVCHGVAPSILLQKHINFLNQSQPDIIRIDHTSKKRGWSILIGRTICYHKKDDSYEYLDRTEDFYLNNFLNNLFFNESCYQCTFNSMPRKTDFTIGDFFGYGVVRKAKLPNSLGISMLMVNSPKGEKLLEVLKEYGVFEERQLEEALYFNHNLWKPSNRNKRTESFKKDYLSKDWSYLENKYQNENIHQKSQIKIRYLIKKLLGGVNTCRLILLYYRFSGVIRKVDGILAEMRQNEKETQL